MVSLKSLVSVALATLAVAAPPQALDTRDFGPAKPSDDAFYKLPGADELSKAKPGDILRHRAPPKPIAVLGLDPLHLKDSHQILYKSIDSHGNDTATVLTVMIPNNADYSKVLSYQIAEDAAWINCAPSYALQLGSNNALFGSIVSKAELALIEAALQQGWIVISPDHEGPKGAWLARDNAAHMVLDGMRAAINSASFTKIKKDAAFAMWGYSGGALASSAAAEEQENYAPELNIIGAAVGGLTPDITSVLYTCNKGPFSGIVSGGIVALTNMYPELATLINQHIKPEYKQKFEHIKTQCLVPNVAEFLYQDVLAMFNDAEGMLNQPFVKDILRKNGLGLGTPKIPIFAYKGVQDELSVVGDSDKLIDTWCKNGAPSVMYYRDLTGFHGTTAVTGVGRSLDFLHSIFNGEKQVSGCKRQDVFSGIIDLQGSKYLPGFLLEFVLDLLGKPVGPLIG